MTPVCPRTLFPVYRKGNDTGPASVETRGGEEGTHQEAEDRDKTETARKADRVCRAQKRPPTALSANPRPGGSAPAGKPLKLGRYFICCLCFVSFFLFSSPRVGSFGARRAAEWGNGTPTQRAKRSETTERKAKKKTKRTGASQTGTEAPKRSQA